MKVGMHITLFGGTCSQTEKYLHRNNSFSAYSAYFLLQYLNWFIYKYSSFEESTGDFTKDSYSGYKYFIQDINQ